MELLDQLLGSGVLRSASIIDAFKHVDRANFVTNSDIGDAYLDKPFPIGFGQTISQPTVVAFMLELLAPEKGERILDIGCGSGWTTALLANCVGPKGQVIGLELIPELVQYGRTNLQKYAFDNAEIQQAQAHVLGLPNSEAFDRILVSAAADKMPSQLLPQFKTRLVMPILNSIWMFDKQSDGTVDEKEYRGFSFVPLL